MFFSARFKFHTILRYYYAIDFLLKKKRNDLQCCIAKSYIIQNNMYALYLLKHLSFMV